MTRFNLLLPLKFFIVFLVICLGLPVWAKISQENCKSFRLDRPGPWGVPVQNLEPEKWPGAMEPLPIRLQSAGLCYAHSAVQLYDALRHIEQVKENNRPIAATEFINSAPGYAAVETLEDGSIASKTEILAKKTLALFFKSWKNEDLAVGGSPTRVLKYILKNGAMSGVESQYFSTRDHYVMSEARIETKTQHHGGDRHRPPEFQKSVEEVILRTDQDRVRLKLKDPDKWKISDLRILKRTYAGNSTGGDSAARIAAESLNKYWASKGTLLPVITNLNINPMLKENQNEGLGFHSVVTMGQRWNHKKSSCEFLIRNSWGKDCSRYLPKFECENGQVWINESLFNKLVLILTVVK